MQVHHDICFMFQGKMEMMAWQSVGGWKGRWWWWSEGESRQRILRSSQETSGRDPEMSSVVNSVNEEAEKFSPGTEHGLNSGFLEGGQQGVSKEHRIKQSN
ncbi:hypothetical protein CHARACLAT_015293 [Characodon lateralis]|uniref:Uncharacterized protein n=1 Tax=Characodon lateralis TaxID=208331 RepID=A0ABU7F3V2_9TELE|nr:hypothetical protein [Characodon lateralis]